MKHYKRMLSNREKSLMEKVAIKMESIQSGIDELMVELSNSKVSEAHLIKPKIIAERAKLVPYAQLKAGIANANSRANYFPQHMEQGEAKQSSCSDKFISFVEYQL